MSDYGKPFYKVMWSYVLRAIVGLLGGIGVGALLGALSLILLVGPVKYVHYLSDPKDRFGISGSPSDGSFTLAMTFVFAFWGAVAGGPLGVTVGLFTALAKSPARTPR